VYSFNNKVFQINVTDVMLCFAFMMEIDCIIPGCKVSFSKCFKS